MQERIDFFISHSHVDKDWAEWISECLGKEGYSTFLGSRDLSVGEDFFNVINDRLEKSESFIAILSPAYFSSSFCQFESSSALAYQKNIIPIKISEEEPSGVLSRLLYLDFYKANEATSKKLLLDAIPLKLKKKLTSKNNGFDSKFNNKFPGKTLISNFNFDFSDNNVLIGGLDKINAIRKAFDSNRNVSSNMTIYGKGGTGKTTIVQKYIEKYSYLYDVIWWISAKSIENIDEEYKKLAQRLEINDSKNISSITLLKKWMQETNRWLFVFDDVSNYKILERFIPYKHKGNILFISRIPLNIENKIAELTIGEYNKEEAISSLRCFGINETDEKIIKLINAVGCLPLSLKMAANQILKDQISIDDYLNLYVFSKNKSYDAELFSSYASVCKEQNDYDRAIEYYTLALNNTAENDYEHIIVIYFNIANIYQEIGYSEKALKYYKLLLDTINITNNSDKNIIANTHNNIATIYFHQSQYEKSLKAYMKALKIMKDTLPEAHPTLATTINNLASVYVAIGDYSKALQYKKQVLQIRENIFGDAHINTAICHIDIAEIYAKISQHTLALLHFEKALKIYEICLGIDYPQNASIYKRMGDICQDLSSFEKSQFYYKKSLQLSKQNNPYFEDSIAPNSVEIISSLDESFVNIIELEEKKQSSYPEIDNILEQLDENNLILFKNVSTELVTWVRIIQKNLIFDSDDKVEICHYSKASTLKHIIKAIDGDIQPKFRVSNIAYLNDPSEGNVLIKILENKINKSTFNSLFGNLNETEKLVPLSFSNVFIGSFSTAKNKLPMWTLYGDDSKGCCLVFDDYFFDEENSTTNANEINESIPNQDLTLYKVKYIEPDNIDESDILIKCINEISRLLDKISHLIEQYDCVKLWVVGILDVVRFLFKDSDYNYESEVRVIIHADSTQIRTDNNFDIPRLYVDLQRKLKYKEIILGSKIDKPVEYAPFLLNSGMVKKVTKSGIHYQ